MHRFTYIYDMYHSKGIFTSSCRKAAAAFFAIALLLAGVTFLTANSRQTNSASSVNKPSISSESDETTLPNLRGEEAVDYLKQRGLYSSLEEAISAARYKVYADDHHKSAYSADNPALRLSMKFDDETMRLVVKHPLASSNDKRESGKATGAKALADNNPRYRTSEASLRLVGAGYGERMLPTTGEPLMTAEANRFTYKHQLSGQWSGVADNQVIDKSDNGQRTKDKGQITEWFINRSEGIEHGFTLNSPPMERDGNERLRVEMEFGGEFSLKANRDGKGLILTSRAGQQVSYDHLKVTDATGRELESEMKARGQRVSIEVADLEAVYPVTIDPVFVPVKKLTASDGAAGDLFGASVSISGDTIVVSAQGDDSIRGAAYVFERNKGGADLWGEVKKITASERDADDNFGNSVSISGDTIVVGAFADDSIRGSAYVFERNAGGADNWGEVKKLTASDGVAGDFFGQSVSISDDTIVVGARGESSFRGAAYVFERNTGGADNWGKVKILTASDGATDDQFGFSVSISSDTLVIGAPGDDSSRGTAYVFERNKGGADNWGEVTKPTASDRSQFDSFGISVSISGDTLVVGANGGNSSTGAAYVFERNKGGADLWGEVTKLTASDGASGDRFGVSVSISGDTLVIGANVDNSSTGAAYLFERNKGGADLWGEVTKLTASDGAEGDAFGFSVSISDDTILVGASEDDSSRGSAYLYVNECDNWIELGKHTASDGATGDQFGWSVSISGDTIVVGALGDNDGGTNSGSAYLFERNKGGANLWGEIKKLTASDGAGSDQFGNSVSISGDTIAVGAGASDSFKGSVYVFERNKGGADNWGEVKKLTASDGAAPDGFGGSVSISGDILVVGASGADTRRGAAYVFERNKGGADLWGEVKRIIASEREVDDSFGGSVSISGDTIVAGAQRADTIRGSAYVFERNNGGADNWGEVKKITASGRSVSDSFGRSVAISGDTIVIGATGNDSLGNNSGAAYLYERNRGGANNWGEVKKITASDGAAGDAFGNSVAISGDTILVGAILDNSFRGAAYVFERNQGGADKWGQITKLTASDGASSDEFSNSVSISGDTIVVGVQKDDSRKGASYIFTINCPPMISTNPVSLDQNSSILGAQIATVTDDITSASNLIVEVESAPAGISVLNITNTDGAITADVMADCPAPLGANSVTLSVMDEHGLVTMADLTVNILAETTPPLINCPADIMTGTDEGECSAVVNFTSTANDGCDGAITPVCSPASGSTFPVGATTVTCSATDAAGNNAQCSFTVTVTDDDAPTVTCPSPITANNDAGQCSAVVNFTATANDGCDGAITPVCTPASGSAFPVGTTTVTCSATDAAGNTGNCSFTVTVNDIQPPVIACPANITATATTPGSSSVIVNYPAPSATDNCSVASVVCTPPSGSAFSVGVTSVTCTATDAAGNSSSCSFTVTTFDVCVQDDSSSSRTLLWNSQTGDYLICFNGTSVSGRGTVTKFGNLFKLTHYASDRRLTAQADKGTNRGSASLQMPVGIMACSITDRDIRNNTCSCSGT